MKSINKTKFKENFERWNNVGLLDFDLDEKELISYIENDFPEVSEDILFNYNLLVDFVKDNFSECVFCNKVVPNRRFVGNICRDCDEYLWLNDKAMVEEVIMGGDEK